MVRRNHWHMAALQGVAGLFGNTILVTCPKYFLELGRSWGIADDD
jgi:hypothetical protein